MHYSDDLRAGDYTVVAEQGLMNTSYYRLGSRDGVLPAWVQSLPGSPFCGADMPYLESNSFVEARIELEYEENFPSDDEAVLY